MEHLSLFLLVLLLGLSTPALPVKVHFAHLGGRSHMKGLFNFKMNVDHITSQRRPSFIEVIVHFDFVCGPRPYTRLPFRSVAYDPRTRRVYGQVATPVGRTTVFSGDLCNPMIGCFDHRKLTPVLVNQRTQPEGDVGPIAAYNGVLYFLYSSKRTDPHGYELLYQLRKLKPGYSVPTQESDPNPLPLDTISTLLYTVEGPSLRAGASLQVVPAADGGLVFVTMFLEPGCETEKAVSVLNVIKVNSGPVGLVVSHARFPELSPLEKPRASVQNDGGITYRSGHLCWVAADHVICGQWRPETALTAPNYVTTLLTVPMVAPVCNATGDALAVRLAGVSLASVTADQQVLVFTCPTQPQWAGAMGVVVSAPTMSTPRLVKVVTSGDSIPSTQVFVTPDDLCNGRRHVKAVGSPVSSKRGLASLFEAI